MARMLPNQGSDHPEPQPVETSRKLFENGRLAMLTYLREEDSVENKAQIEAGARRLGYDKVEYVHNTNGPNNTHAYVFIKSETHEAVVAIRGTEGGPSPRNVGTYVCDCFTGADHLTPQEKSNAKGWLTNFKSDQIKDPVYGTAQVHSGFDGAAKSVEQEVSEKLRENHIHSVEVAGHSQGGGITKLLSVRLAADPELAKAGCRVTGSYAYEPPGVTDTQDLANRYRELGIDKNANTVGQRNDIVIGVGGQNLWGQFHNCYNDGIGGQDPAHPGRGVGNYYHVNVDERVWQNPSQGDVRADKTRAFFAPVDGPSPEPGLKGKIQTTLDFLPDRLSNASDAHFGFDRALFRNMPEKDQAEWIKTVEQDVAAAKKELSHATTEDDVKRWKAELSSAEREERALQNPPLLPNGRRMAEGDWADPDGTRFRSHVGESPTLGHHQASVASTHASTPAQGATSAIPTFHSHVGEPPTFGRHHASAVSSTHASAPAEGTTSEIPTFGSRGSKPVVAGSQAGETPAGHTPPQTGVAKPPAPPVEPQEHEHKEQRKGPRM